MNFKNINKLLLLSSLAWLSACSNLLFYPDKEHFHTPTELNLSYEDVFFDSEDGETLHSWWLPASTEETKGSILFLHGNAENISTHFSNVAWLPAQGYNILALDYRGFGKSTGSPNLPDVLLDIDAAFKHLASRTDGPIFILGQSIGAALSVTYLGSSEIAQERTDALIVDAGFPSFRQLAREKLDQVWLTWPFQVPLSWLIPNEYDPEKYIGNIAPIPIMFFHSENDYVVPLHHGLTLMKLGTGPQTFSQTKPPHTATFIDRDQQAILVEFLSGERQKQM